MNILALAMFAVSCACLAAALLIWRGVSVGAFRSPVWPPRDWRKLLAMFLLSGGGMAMTVFGWHLVGLVAERSPNDPYPLAKALYGTLGLIGLAFVFLGWTLGKSNLAGKLGAASFDASGGDDEEDPPAPGTTTLTATATVTPPAAQE